MAHSIERSAPPLSRDVAGPLQLDHTVRREWDIVMTREDRWVLCLKGLLDPDQVKRRLTDLRRGNPSGSVTYRVIERVLSMSERLVDEDESVTRPQSP